MKMTMIVVFVLIEASAGVDFAGNRGEGNEKTTNDGEFKPRRRVDSQNNSE